ncbi:MAG: universal stress protein [Cupriavidus sp.]|nr:universal stress protein [Cupriavidus sp.]
MLGYTSIFVHQDASARAGVRLDIAARLALAHQCRLVGLCTMFSPDPDWFYRMDHAAKCLQEDLEHRRHQRDCVRQRFEQAMADQTLQAEWRAVEGEPVAKTLREIHEAGLVVAGQFDEGDAESFVAPQFLESLVLESGRPVLVIPYTGQFPTIGSRTLLAWDGGREASRALHDALPLLVGSRVHLLHANASMHSLRTDAAPASSAARLLSDIGAQVEIENEPAANDLAIGELILSRASDIGADLIVMGAYGHGRFRELLLGGVTRTILSSMTVPVLMTH